MRKLAQIRFLWFAVSCTTSNFYSEIQTEILVMLKSKILIPVVFCIEVIFKP